MRAQILLVAILAIGAAACSDDQAPAPAVVSVDEAEGSPTLAVRAQEASDSLTVDRAVLPQPGGYVAAYEARNDAPGPLLGVTELLSPGEHRSVEIPLGSTPEAGTGVFLVLHEERSGDGRFEFPGPDQPVAVDGRILTIAVTLD